MPETDPLDALFQQAVAAIDASDLPALKILLEQHPPLVRDRLESPGPWLRDKIGDALDGFFERPYLLWFIAEDPVRNGTLPPNIADVARLLIAAAERNHVPSLQEQLDTSLRLVCWSWIARDAGVQIPLIDVLLEAGADVNGRAVYGGRYGSHTDSAIYNSNFAAAEHLLDRGAEATLSTALCLGRWADVDRLLPSADLEERQDAFVLAALKGRAEGLRRMLAAGLSPTTVSAQNQSHATALHHAVWSGSIEAVQVLVEAGADVTRRDTIYNGTPLNWAEHAGGQTADPARRSQYESIAAYLRNQHRPNG